VRQVLAAGVKDALSQSARQFSDANVIICPSPVSFIIGSGIPTSVIEGSLNAT
jgi:hypothetical protein